MIFFHYVNIVGFHYENKVGFISLIQYLHQKSFWTVYDRGLFLSLADTAKCMGLCGQGSQAAVLREKGVCQAECGRTPHQARWNH